MTQTGNAVADCEASVGGCRYDGTLMEKGWRRLQCLDIGHRPLDERMSALRCARQLTRDEVKPRRCRNIPQNLLVTFSAFESDVLELEPSKRNACRSPQRVAICQKERLLRCHIKLSRRRFTDMIFPGRHGSPGRPRAFLANQASSRTHGQTPGRAVALNDENSNKGSHQDDFWGPVHSQNCSFGPGRAGI